MTADQLRAYIELLEYRIKCIDLERIQYEEFIDTCHSLGFDIDE